VLREAFFPDNGPPPQHQPSDNLEGFHPVTQEEVLKALEAIPPNSAPGDDTLPPSIWIRLHKIRPHVLTNMTDWSLRSRTLPTILKRVLTMGIPKPGKPDYSVPKAYRMISLLPTLSKTIEHVALARMTVFAPNWLSPLQFACRKGYSPFDAVHLILEKVYKVSNDKLYSSALFLDIQGAFDKVLHQRLAVIMTHSKFPPYLVDWVHSYLSDRSVRIMDGAASEPAFTPIQVGIPQGSPLSIFLFNFYSSPLCHNYQRLGVDLMVSYVDDYCFLAISVSWQRNAITLTAAGNQLQCEANQGGMNFDLSKTELFHFPYGKHLPTADLPGVLFGEHHISNDLEQRWVGLFFDETLRATLQIEKHAAKAATTLYKLAPLLKKLKPEMASRLIKATVIPALTFGLEIYTKAHINNTEVVPINMTLKAAAKILTGCWQKAELRAICAEAGLLALNPLIKKCALSAAARLLYRVAQYPLHPLLPWNRTRAYNLKKGTRNYSLAWTTDTAPQRTGYLQLDGVLNHILPLIQDTNEPTRPSKAVIQALIQQYTLEDFTKRPNPRHTYLPRGPNNTGVKGLLPRRLCHWISSIHLGHGWCPHYLKRLGYHNGKCPWCRVDDANRQHMIMECNAIPHPTAHLTNGLTFRELAYEDLNLPKLIEILRLNKIGLRVTIQEDFRIP